MYPASPSDGTSLPDGVTYTFHLRKDALWSDGHPVTAQDVHGAYCRILAPEFGSDNAESLYFMAGAEAFHKSQLTDFESVGCHVLDDHTLVLRTVRPTPFFVRLLAARNWFPLPIHVLSEFNSLRRKDTA
ncbi:MAG: hypothetical protein J6386_24785 [Candidatus Synoicihabitans palmerolidicus]|nr:hypothetical protein [Candidatus Synoicihabitans palmerolidicus]